MVDPRRSKMTVDSPHGRGGYNRGCRCAECTAANRAYNREYMRTWRWQKKGKQ